MAKRTGGRLVRDSGKISPLEYQRLQASKAHEQKTGFITSKPSAAARWSSTERGATVMDPSKGKEKEGVVNFDWITREADNQWQSDVDDEYYAKSDTAGQSQT